MDVSDDFIRPRSSLDVRRRSQRRATARRRAAARRRRTAALTVIVAAATTALLIIGANDRSRGGAGPHALARAIPVAARTGPARPAWRVLTPVPSPGSLPQTRAFPSGTSAQFKSLMASLWAGVVHDSLAQALVAFFPKGAYVQLKAIADAGSDWTDRLVNDYGLDIAAAHALLGRGARNAALVGVKVEESYGHWIQPGVCYNSVGYYEMPNARVVYRENGQLRSFGIASMISWRGVWYVVHLGAILRSTAAGTVDQPASGPGRSIYSGTC